MRINALGTQHVLARWPYAHVVLASTCKACNPETAYGASKLIAERLVLNSGGSVARFHNVRQTRGNVFETWHNLIETQSLSADPVSLPVTPCHRYFIDIDDALRLLTTVPGLPSGRYMLDPGAAHWMPDVARATHPNHPWHFIEKRRGDRTREPLHATHEGIDYAPGRDWNTTDGIWKVVSPHD